MRLVICAAMAVVGLGSGVAAQDKEDACRLQGQVIGAVQQARLDRVRKDKVEATVLEANPSWPSGTAQAVAPVVEYVYGIKRRDLKNVDLAASTEASCLENWDQIQQLKNGLSN